MTQLLTFDEFLENLNQEFIWNDSFLEAIKKNILIDEDFVNEIHNDITENVTEIITGKLTSGELSPEVNTLYRQANILLESHIKSIIESNRGMKLLLASAFDEESAQKLYNLFEHSAFQGISKRLEDQIAKKLDEYVAKAISENNPVFCRSISSQIIDGVLNDIVLENTLIDNLSKRINSYLTGQAHILAERIDDQLAEETAILGRSFNLILKNRSHELAVEIESRLTNKADTILNSLKEDVHSEIMGEFSERIRDELFDTLRNDLDKSFRVEVHKYLNEYFPESLSQDYKRLKGEITLLNKEIDLLQQKKSSLESTINSITRSMTKANFKTSSYTNPKSLMDATVKSQITRRSTDSELPIDLIGFNIYGYDEYEYGLKLNNCKVVLDAGKQTIKVIGEIEIYDFKKVKLNMLWGKNGAKATFQFEVYDNKNEIIRTCASNVYLDSSDQSKFAFNIYIPIQQYGVELLSKDISKVVISLMQ